MDKNFTDSLVTTIVTNKKVEAEKKKGDRVALVGFGSFSVAQKAAKRGDTSKGHETEIEVLSWNKAKADGFPGSTERFGAYAKIAAKLAVKNPEVAKKFNDKIEALKREEQDEVAITSYKRAPARKVVKFKAGSELADSVKSVGPDGGLDSEVEVIEYRDAADVKKLAEELVNLTVKEVNEPTDTKVVTPDTSLDEVGAEVEIKSIDTDIYGGGSVEIEQDIE